MSEHTHEAIAQITATRCCVCKAHLTDAESVEHGIGPTCSSRYYNPLHEPSDQQVKDALGLLAVSGLADHILDGFVKLVNNDKANARAGSNLLVYWASAHYDNRSEVFKCTAIICALGYTDLADKLEIDRTEARVTDMENGILTVYVGTKGPFKRELSKIPGIVPMTQDKVGAKERWDIPEGQLDHFILVLGLFYANKLACGDRLPGGQRVWTIGKTTWQQLSRYRNPPPPPVPQAPTTPPQRAPQPSETIIPPGSLGLVLSGGWVEIYVPYNAGFKDALKNSVTYSARKWTGKCWKVKAQHIDTVTHLLRQHFGKEFIA